MVNISFDSITINTLKTMIGKTFADYCCDPFIYSPNVFGIVGFHINGKTYRLTNALHSVKRFFHEDDVAIIRFEECTNNELVSMMDDGQMINNPVHDTINSIDIINDIETVIHDSDQKGLISTKGIVFHLSSGNEISFEVGTWFSEMITIRRGYDLVKQFTPIDEFLEEWSENENYLPKCTREIVSIT